MSFSKTEIILLTVLNELIPLVTLLPMVVFLELTDDHAHLVSHGVTLGKVKIFPTLRSVTASVKVFN